MPPFTSSTRPLSETHQTQIRTHPPRNPEGSLYGMRVPSQGVAHADRDSGQFVDLNGPEFERL